MKMSSEDEFMTQEEVARTLTDDELAVAVAEVERRATLAAKAEVARLMETVWGHCECGREFNMFEREQYSFCPGCGVGLIKDG